VPTDRTSAKNIPSLNTPRSCKRKSPFSNISEATLKVVKSLKPTSLPQ
jgi:hypothetical protein